MMEDNKDKGLSPKALENLKRNDFFRKFEWGIEEIPYLEHSIQGAIFDAERIDPEIEKKQADGRNVLKCKFTYIITDGLAPPWEIGLYKITVDAKASSKIDGYLSRGINVLDIRILRSPKAIRYHIKPYEHCQSVSGIRTYRRVRKLLTNTQNKKTNDIVVFKTAYELLLEQKQEQLNLQHQLQHWRLAIVKTKNRKRRSKR
jgi:hypothetical protein